MNVRIFRDIDELKIWGNELGFRFHRDSEDKTKYKVYFTDDDVDKLEAFIRQQQDEIEALEKPKIPLLEQEIKFILGNGQCWQGEDCSMPNLMYIIRAVEAAHGIGVKQDEHL
jgi:hypothetical protein